MSSGDRAEHLAEVADALWPAPASWQATRGRRSGAELLVVPNATSPRLVLPAQPRLAAAALRNAANGTGWRTRARDAALLTLFRTRLHPLVLRDRLRVEGEDLPGSLRSHLREHAGVAGHWAMPVSRARANRKPVLQMIGDDGAPVAFVKVGTNPLTARLVRDEADALRALHRSGSKLDIPRVLWSGSWQDLELLVLAPLPLRGQTAEPPWDAVVATARTIAEVNGRRTAVLRETTYWRDLGGRLTGHDDERSRALATVWRDLDGTAARSSLDLGAWHGDWAPWNMAWVDGRVLVWDFERFAGGVPIGFDLVHHDLQTRILDPQRDTETIVSDRLVEAPRLLGPLGVRPEAASLVVAAYLLEIGGRWVADRQDEAGDWGAVLDGIVRSAAVAAVSAVAASGTPNSEVGG